MTSTSWAMGIFAALVIFAGFLLLLSVFLSWWEDR
jgi:hypothetical protein